MTVMLAAWNWSNTCIIAEQDAAEFSSGSGATPAGIAHPVSLEHAMPSSASALPVASSVGPSDVSVVSGGAYGGGDVGMTSGTDASAYQGYNSYQGH